MSSITDVSGTFRLHNGVEMPYLGLGVYLAREGKEVGNAVGWALEAGYRHIDTASAYQNETGVGAAVRNSGIDRREVFVTSKVWNTDQGYESTLRAFDLSLDRLGLEYLDLYLVHWPVKGKFRETWRALEKLYRDGRVRAIGVSNFLEHHLKDLLRSAEVVPMVNQMEFHPWLVQEPLLGYCREKGIQYEAWSPLMQGEIVKVKEINEIARKYGKTEAQVVLRWDLQKGVATIPKSSNPDRIKANAALFDFELSPGDMALLDGLDKKHRFGPDPDHFDF